MAGRREGGRGGEEVGGWEEGGREGGREGRKEQGGSGGMEGGREGVGGGEHAGRDRGKSRERGKEGRTGREGRRGRGRERVRPGIDGELVHTYIHEGFVLVLLWPRRERERLGEQWRDSDECREEHLYSELSYMYVIQYESRFCVVRCPD